MHLDKKLRTVLLRRIRVELKCLPPPHWCRLNLWFSIVVLSKESGTQRGLKGTTRRVLKF